MVPAQVQLIKIISLYAFILLFTQACGKNSITMEDMQLVTDENNELTAFTDELAAAGQTLDEARRSIQDNLAALRAMESTLLNV